jgi:hypothetical protein
LPYLHVCHLTCEFIARWFASIAAADPCLTEQGRNVAATACCLAEGDVDADRPLPDWLRATEVTMDLFPEPGAKGSIITQVFDSQADDRDTTPLPLQVSVAIINVAAGAAVVRTIGLYDHGPATTYYQYIRAPSITCSQADTWERCDRETVVFRKASLKALKRPIHAEFFGAAER